MEFRRASTDIGGGQRARSGCRGGRGRSRVSTSLIYKWRREDLDAARGSGFAPVMLEDKTCSSAPKSEAAMITVELGGAVVRIGASAPAALVVATLKALQT